MKRLILLSLDWRVGAHPAPGLQDGGVTYAACTSPFNILRVSYTSPTTGLKHTGVDLAPGGENTEIISFTYGIVWDRFYDNNYGNVMFIKNNKESLLYMLCHLESFIAKKGDSVTPGQPVAKTGMTGNWGGTGIHLHLEVREIASETNDDIYSYTNNVLTWNLSKYQGDARRDAFNHKKNWG